MYDAMDILGKKGLKGEIFFKKSENLNLGYEGWTLKKGEVNEESGVSIRLIKDGRVGFAGTTYIEQFDDMLDKAIATSKVGEEIDLNFPGKTDAKKVNVFCQRLAGLSQKKLMEWADFIKEELSDLRTECELKMEFTRSYNESHLTNTSGADCEGKKSYLGLSVELSKMEQNDILMIYDVVGVTHLADFEPELKTMLARIKEKYRIAKTIVPFAGGKVPVVYHPEAVYALLIPFFQGVNGSNVVTGASPLLNRIGEKLFSEKLSIYDDGSLDHKPGSSTYDSEGFAKRRVPLVENGVLKNYILDLTKATKLGMKPTGTSSRGIFGAPSPSGSNTILSGGDIESANMIKGIKEGILLHDLLGMGQGNTLSGDFSNPVSVGLKIENGEIIGRVKNVAVSGNIYEHLKEITALSSDRRWQWASLHLPYIRMDNLNVASKK